MEVDEVQGDQSLWRLMASHEAGLSSSLVVCAEVGGYVWEEEDICGGYGHVSGGVLRCDICLIDHIYDCHAWNFWPHQRRQKHAWLRLYDGVCV